MAHFDLAAEIAETARVLKTTPEAVEESVVANLRERQRLAQEIDRGIEQLDRSEGLSSEEVDQRLDAFFAQKRA